MANQNIKILALEASASPPSAALYLDGEIVERVASTERTHADLLLDLVDRLLQQTNLSLQDLTGLACGRGPGSFTGLRVAAAVAQGLAYTAKKPVAMVSSLAALALGAQSEMTQHDNQPTSILACIDARKQQVYSGLFKSTGAGLIQLEGEEQVCDPEQVPVEGVNCVGVGNGFEQYPQLKDQVQAVISPEALMTPRAYWVAQLAANGYANFAPAYMATPVYIRDNVTHNK